MSSRLPVICVNAWHLSCVASMSAHPFQNGFAARGEIRHQPLLLCEAAGVLTRSQCFGASPARHSIKASDRHQQKLLRLHSSLALPLQDWCYVSVIITICDVLTHLVSLRLQHKAGGCTTGKSCLQPLVLTQAMQQMLEQYWL